MLTMVEFELIRLFLDPDSERKWQDGTLSES